LLRKKACNRKPTLEKAPSHDGAFLWSKIKNGYSMKMVAQKFESFKDVKEYRYWQSRPASERIAAGHQMSVEGYRAHGHPTDGRELKTVAVRLQREPR
jgi:hypothetical protein